MKMISALHTDTKTVLLTGASGVVGSALLSELDDCDVLALMHRQPPPGPVAGTIRGDLTSPRLGLDRRQLRQLASRVDAIVHCAAAVNFDAGHEVAESVNVTGTTNMLELARMADAPLYYVSTAFVARADRVDPDEGPGVYIASKRAAEKAVRDSGLPAVLIRPSVVSGDSETGAITQFQGFHHLCGAAIRGMLPMLPVPDGASIDFLPQDVVARCIADIVARGERDGERWLTAGTAALSVDRIVDLIVATAHEQGVPIARPKLVDPDLMERLIRPVFLSSLPPDLQRKFDQLLAMMPLFYSVERFASSLDDLDRDVTADELEDAFAQSLHYWAEEKLVARAERRAA
jgi:nucleoside-diphosphate-sugar epimerase